MRNVVFMAYSFTTKSNFSFCSRYDTGDGRKGTDMRIRTDAAGDFHLLPEPVMGTLLLALDF